MSAVQELKDAVIAESGATVWQAILEGYDSELNRLLQDGDMTAFLNSLDIADIGMTGGEYSNIVAANPAPPSQSIAAQTVFYEFPVWAEENGALSAANSQWSFGNGATGNFGIPMRACEVYAMSLNVETFGTSVTMNLMQDQASVQTETFTSNNQLIQFASPISFSEGQLLGFQTASVVGTNSDARITAWCRAPISAPAIQGEQGPAGQDGADGVGGVPNAYARIDINSGGNINTAAFSTVSLNSTPTLNTIGVSVSSNVISVPAGIYTAKAIINSSTTAQRPNQEIQMLRNGVSYSVEFGENYIRSSGGHNEAKLTYTDIIDFSSAGTLELQTRQISTTGTVTIGAGSKILLHKIA